MYFLLPAGASHNDTRPQKILDAGYRIILNESDELSDLNGYPQTEHSVKPGESILFHRVGSLRSRLLWNCLAIGTRIGSGEVHIPLRVSYDCLTLSHREGKWLKQLNLVSATC